MGKYHRAGHHYLQAIRLDPNYLSGYVRLLVMIGAYDVSRFEVGHPLKLLREFFRRGGDRDQINGLLLGQPDEEWRAMERLLEEYREQL